MICKKCGTQVDDNEKFCPVCGEPLEAAAPAVNDVAAPVPFGLAIASIILSETGIVGLILAIITRSKMKAYVNAGGLLTGKAKAADIISKIALALAIVCVVAYAISFIVGIALGLSGALAEFA